MSHELYHKFKDFIEERKCILCNETYNEWENVGQLKCRYHSLAPRFYGDKYYYQCCSTYVETVDDKPPGCCKCDHLSQNDTIDTRVQIWKYSMFVPYNGVILFPVRDSVIDRLEVRINGTDGKRRLDIENSHVKFLRFTLLKADTKKDEN